MGLYLMQVLDAKGKTWLDPLLRPLERGIYRLARVDARPADTGFSLARTRSLFEYRAVAVGPGRGALDEVLPTGPVRPVRDVAFVFSGQGSQWARMGLGLLGWL